MAASRTACVLVSVATVVILLQELQPTVPAAAVMNSNSSDILTSLMTLVLVLSATADTDSDSDSSNYFRLRMIDSCRQSAADGLRHDNDDIEDVAQSAC